MNELPEILNSLRDERLEPGAHRELLREQLFQEICRNQEIALWPIRRYLLALAAAFVCLIVILLSLPPTRSLQDWANERQSISSLIRRTRVAESMSAPVKSLDNLPPVTNESLQQALAQQQADWKMALEFEHSVNLR